MHTRLSFLCVFDLKNMKKKLFVLFVFLFCLAKNLANKMQTNKQMSQSFAVQQLFVCADLCVCVTL